MERPGYGAEWRRAVDDGRLDLSCNVICGADERDRDAGAGARRDPRPLGQTVRPQRLSHLHRGHRS